MKCYRKGDCGPFEMYSCNVCPASKPEYLNRYGDEKPEPREKTCKNCGHHRLFEE